MQDHKSNMSDIPESEQFFSQITEDFRLLEQAVERWESLTGNAESIDFLFLAITVHNGRLLKALELLNTTPLPAEYIQYIPKIRQRFSTIAGRISTAIHARQTELADLFVPAGPFDDRLNEAVQGLRNIRRIAQDGILFDNQAWLADDLRDSVHDFLLRFTDLAWLAYHPPSELAGLQAFAAWQARFKEVESVLRKFFGYFEPIVDLLEKIRAREYGIEFWWLTDNPAAMETADSLTEEQLEALARVALSAPSQNEPCAEYTELAIAYASDDPISESDKEFIQDHIAKCNACLDLVLNMRAAMAEAATQRAEVVESSPEEFDRTLAELHKRYPGRVILEDYDTGPAWPPKELPDIVMIKRLEQRYAPLHMEATVITGKRIHALAEWLQAGKRKGCALLPIFIEEFFADGVFTVTGQVDAESLKMLPPTAEWRCAWTMPNDESLLPEKFDYDRDSGIFSAIFHCMLKPAGAFRLHFLITDAAG